MNSPDLFSVDGLLASGVVDFVWGRGWRAPTLQALRQAQHGIDSSPGVALPDRAVVFCFSMQFREMLAVLPAGGRYVVISRDSDPGATEKDCPACVHHVFSGNAVASARLTPMPGAFGPFRDAIIDGLVSVRRVVPRRRTGRVLVSHSLDTPGSVYHAAHERITAIERFRGEPWARVNENLLGWATRTGPVWPSWNPIEYYSMLREYDYLAVPRGYGVDRYAQWEAIALGTIPICLKHPELLSFADTPLTFVDRWEDVTEPWCEANLGALQRSQEKITLSYWVERVQEKRSEIGL